MTETAPYSDKQIAVDVLTQAFDSNTHVSYFIADGCKRTAQIRSLMEYSYDMCMLFGEVYLSDDHTSCALVLLPHTRRLTLKGITLEIKFLFFCSSIRKLLKILRHEEAIRNWHTEPVYAHLWFLGVIPAEQGKGHGSRLLLALTSSLCTRGLAVYLETDLPATLPWYHRNGFVLVTMLDTGYPLFILKKEVNLFHALARTESQRYDLLS